MKKFLGSVAALALLATQTAQSEERWLRVHNDTSYNLCEVYVSHIDADNWQSDRIGSCLSPGRYRTIDPGWQQGYCMMDMKFVFDDGEVIIEEAFDICSGEDFYLND